jgi:hypothetical protein
LILSHQELNLYPFVGIIMLIGIFQQFKCRMLQLPTASSLLAAGSENSS